MSDAPATQRGIVVVTAEDRPDLWAQAEDAFRDVWPEYNQHGDVSGEYFGALVPRYAHLQFVAWEIETNSSSLGEGRSRSAGTGRWPTCPPASTPWASAPCATRRPRRCCRRWPPKCVQNGGAVV